MSRDRARPQARALVVSPSCVARTARAQVLEEHGLAVVEAAQVDDACWALVAARAGDAPPVEVVVVDQATRDLERLVAELRRARPSPGLVLVTEPEPAQVRGAATFEGVDVHVVAPRAEALPAVVERALSRRARQIVGPRALLAVGAPSRRAAAAGALAQAGASVVVVTDGLELLEVLGANLALAPVAWAPEVLILEARLERVDGIDALAEIRELDVETPAVLLADADDVDARTRGHRLLARVLDAEVAPAELARVALAARPTAWRALRPLRAG